MMHEVKAHLQTADDEDTIKEIKITLGDGGFNQLVSIPWMFANVRSVLQAIYKWPRKLKLPVISWNSQKTQ